MYYYSLQNKLGLKKKKKKKIILSRVSGLMQFRDGSDKGTETM
jgi:hypothetical protein